MNHVIIGSLYLTTGLLGGSIGLALSLFLRIEIGMIGFIISSSHQYLSIISFHALFMIFFFIMPILIGGFGNILIPIMLGKSDLIFPRLNSLSLWLFLLSLFILYLSFIIFNGINCGWTFYPPLSLMNGISIDLLFFSLHLAGISSIISSINFIITIISRFSFNILFDYWFALLFLSLYLWSILITSFLLLLSLPILASAITMILLDKYFNASFFIPIFGGDVILLQHLFWLSSHPEVYILILPAFGLISDILSRSSNIIIFGRDSMIICLISIGFLGCIVWGHHMFNIGFDIDSRSYYSSSTTIIAIPTGIKIFNWLITLWNAHIQFIISLLFLFGFLFSFSFGGLSGIVLANSLIDILLHDSYFVIAHFHYILSLGAVYSIFASFYIYFHYIFSFNFIDFIARSHFISFFFSSNILFFPMHSLGIIGHPRRIFDYPLLFSNFHFFQSIGIIGILLSISCLLFV